MVYSNTFKILVVDGTFSESTVGHGCWQDGGKQY